jgi:hypothetical protein
MLEEVLRSNLKLIAAGVQEDVVEKPEKTQSDRHMEHGHRT